MPQMTTTHALVRSLEGVLRRCSSSWLVTLFTACLVANVVEAQELKQPSDLAIEEETIAVVSPKERRQTAYAIEEELVVSGREEHIASPRQILAGYDAHGMGEYYYNLRLYDKAYPYLLEAAQEGFKMSQARLGFLYQQGLGGAERDWRKAIGWIGVAASPSSHPEIKNYWKNMKAKIPIEQLEMVEELVEDYIDRFGSDATRMSCDINRPAGSHIARMRCYYDDELLYRDPGDNLGVPGVQIDSSVGGGGGGI